MEKENEFIFEQAIRIADVLVKLFGSRCEVAIHDFSDLEQSLIYLAGKLTGRDTGAPITDLVLKQLKSAQSDAEIKDIVNYRTVSDKGLVMKSSTAFLRNQNKEIIGAFCINFDISLFIQLGGEIEGFINFQDNKEENESFYSSVQEVTENMVKHVLKQFHKAPTQLDTDEKIECVRQLENKGAFLVKGATEYLANVLGVSKFTIYNYLQKIRMNDTFQTNKELI